MNEIGQRPAIYEIRVHGMLDEQWSDWCGGMSLTSTMTIDGAFTTTLTGMVRDQAALRGILVKLWDLGLTLLAVSRIEADGSEYRRK